MTWLIPVLVVLAVIGSIYGLKPSPRDARLGQLRLDATKAGLQVRHCSFQVDAAKTGVREDITGIGYTLVFRPPSHDDTKPQEKLLFRIVGQPGWESQGLPEGLSWHDLPGDPALGQEQRLVLAQALSADIQSALAGFPDDVLLLELYENRVSLIPAERKAATAEAYKQALTALSALAG
ncbi:MULTISPECIES: hypothetical protein [unclassified Oceanobacter]|uniref:hypothetical protein n=1 Tax=unclassified Oceanobacter TaxID=2620260 RepID=UPI0026E1576B|nr:MULTISPECIES: hypothetical protein [unclassified Oceanobacter]MDO6683045.1 hypothetical protein [Oceanobacter sp. 5_MG-2023]MDP2507057.1 hypothetical protein [Oceanobacter sp. 3_MG-2023]